MVMADAFDTVLMQALRLPDEERRALVVYLLGTFQPGDIEDDAAWGETGQRRLAAIAKGFATTVPWLTARQQIADDERPDDLGEALDLGIAELDSGQGIESSIDEFMAEIDAAVGLAP
jgi:hypothetical protein